MKFTIRSEVVNSFEAEVDAESVIEAQILTYQKVLEVFDSVIGFSIKSISVDNADGGSIEN